MYMCIYIVNILYISCMYTYMYKLIYIRNEVEGGGNSILRKARDDPTWSSNMALAGVGADVSHSINCLSFFPCHLLGTLVSQHAPCDVGLWTRNHCHHWR